MVLTYRYSTPEYIGQTHVSIRLQHQARGIDLRARALSRTENSQEDKTVVYKIQ